MIYRRRGKDKTGHAHNGSLLSYSDSAGEKLLPQNGTLPRYPQSLCTENSVVLPFCFFVSAESDYRYMVRIGKGQNFLYLP